MNKQYGNGYGAGEPPYANQGDTSVLGTPVWGPPTGTPMHDDTIGEPEKKSGGLPRAGVLIAAAAAVSLLAGGVGGAVGYTLAGNEATVASPVVSGEAGGSPESGTVAAVAAAVTPAVVNIEAGQGTGSGFIVRSDGYIVTNNHVVEGANDLTVNFSDGTSKSATLVGTDAGYDLAVIKVDGEGLPVVTLGDSDKVHVGDTAIAVGSPLGLSNTVTQGIVSALDRPVTAGDQGGSSFISAIQTDAAVNPGNSGGPLLDGAGNVIGVNSAIATLGQGAGGQGGSIGLGFAIPVNTAQRIADEIMATGSAETPVIGASVNTQASGQDGVVIESVTPGGPADKAGLSDGDVVVAVDGKPVSDGAELIVAIRAKTVGDQVTLTLANGSEVQVTLGAS